MTLKAAYTFSFFLVFILRVSCCFAQSAFDKDSLIVKGKVVYTTPSKNAYSLSTNKAFLHPGEKNKALTNDAAYINGDFINQGEFARKYITAISRQRSIEIARNPDMTLLLQFNTSGRVDDVKFIISKNGSLTPEDLMVIDSVIKSSVQIKLPASVKHAHKIEPYPYLFNFLQMAAYTTERGEPDSLHTDWVNNDINLIKEVAALDKNTPQSVVDFFGPNTDNHTQRDTLGFGWTYARTGRGAGYISINLEYYIYNGKIVSYALSSQLPRRADLANKYDPLLRKIMPVDSELNLYYKFREDRILTPLSNIAHSIYKKQSIPLQMLQYMSPLSGTLYGYYGGISMNMVANRAMFKEIIKKLSPDQVVTLMYSINPASRLTAIEYYYRHPELFKNHESIDKWIKVVYAAKPTIESINGCFISDQKVEDVVNGFVKWHDPLDD